MQQDKPCQANLCCALQALLGSAGVPTVGNVLPQAAKVRDDCSTALTACPACDQPSKLADSAQQP
jgi:hypothetical protein